jgi:hypothetical protein
MGPYFFFFLTAFFLVFLPHFALAIFYSSYRDHIGRRLGHINPHLGCVIQVICFYGA